MQLHPSDTYQALPGQDRERPEPDRRTFTFRAQTLGWWRRYHARLTHARTLPHPEILQALADLIVESLESLTWPARGLHLVAPIGPQQLDEVLTPDELYGLAGDLPEHAMLDPLTKKNLMSRSPSAGGCSAGPAGPGDASPSDQHSSAGPAVAPDGSARSPAATAAATAPGP